jgi:membrane-bound lytic murein transglycosylase MltF
VKIQNVHRVENNIHAGARLMHFIVNDYFKDESMDPMNKTLMAFASYNAGPAKIARLRRKAAEQGLDPNRWFRNVELVVAREIGRETTQYVSNVYKYYLAYRIISERAVVREKAVQSARLGRRTNRVHTISSVSDLFHSPF